MERCLWVPSNSPPFPLPSSLPPLPSFPSSSSFSSSSFPSSSSPSSSSFFCLNMEVETKLSLQWIFSCFFMLHVFTMLEHQAPLKIINHCLFQNTAMNIMHACAEIPFQTWSLQSDAFVAIVFTANYLKPSHSIYQHLWITNFLQE